MTTVKTDLFNSRQRKALEIIAVVLDENYNTIDAICPGEGNHRTAIEWAEWRAKTIRDTYEDAAVIAVYCGDNRVANVELDPREETAEEAAEVEETESNEETEEFAERVLTLKYELQQYYDDQSKGGEDRERNMMWLQQDIKRLEAKRQAV